MRKEDLQRTLEVTLIYIKQMDELIVQQIAVTKNQGIKVNPAFSKMYI